MFHMYCSVVGTDVCCAGMPVGTAGVACACTTGMAVGAAVGIAVGIAAGTAVGGYGAQPVVTTIGA